MARLRATITVSGTKLGEEAALSPSNLNATLWVVLQGKDQQGDVCDCVVESIEIEELE
jgi:hypothetical protein